MRIRLETKGSRGLLPSAGRPFEPAKTRGARRSRRGARFGNRDNLPTVILCACFALSAVGARGQQPPSSLVIWDFNRSLTNPFGGQYNSYSREPSWARTYLDSDVPLAPTGKPWSKHSLRITAHREAAGFCGVWFAFKPAPAPTEPFLDASRFKYLSFWVKGQKGGEDFDIALADDSALTNEDAKVGVPLSAYLPAGATKSWQEVLIPLANFRGLHLDRLLRMTIDLTREGDYRFYIAEIAFKTSLTASVGVPPDVDESEPVVSPLPYAMWVWNSEKLLDAATATKFVDFCVQHGIQEVYFSLDLDRNSEAGQPHFELRNPEGYRKFLETAHAKGLKIDGLAGSPEWAARESHPIALAAMQAVLEFNRTSPPGARFDGFHLDVEPYLLPGYLDPIYRSQLLEDFVQLIAECAERATSVPHFRVGCDVPAWFYPATALGDPSLEVTYNGIKKPEGEQLTDLLDSVTIMDYRNEADGSGGIIAGASPALDYAAKQGKRIVVGLETSRDPDSVVYFVGGLTLEQFQRKIAESGFRNRLYFENWRIATLSDGANVYLGLTAPVDVSDAPRKEFEQALFRFAQKLGGLGRADGFDTEEARAAVAHDSEWKGFAAFEVPGTSGLGPLVGFSAVHQMLPKITFHGLGREVFEEETRSAVEWFKSEPSFQGLAVHYYETYRDLLESKKVEEPRN